MFKFPSTPHLANLGSIAIRDDKVFSEVEQKDFLSYYLYVEEKIDGANLGISFTESRDMLIQNRGSYLYPPFVGQWKRLPDWLKTHQNELFDSLSSKYILFGEWCYAQHSIKYNKLPDWFLIFDLYDKEEERFLSNKLPMMFKTVFKLKE